MKERMEPDCRESTRMELLSPAGTFEKLQAACAYGADAAYMGLTSFSMRAGAGNFDEHVREELHAWKKSLAGQGKKLYCTLNTVLHESRLDEMKAVISSLGDWPFDAYIVSDLGVASLLKERYPDCSLHLSTQASCLNSVALRVYRNMGFSRIVLGREATLADIKMMKDAVPAMELEVFIHGAMCMAYSGRCLLSSFMAGRSANEGACSHTCRWNYRLALEEKERPGVYYPIEEYEDYTTILSSKDLNMIDHLKDLQESGVTSLKIEGRMKSVYYTAVVTRAYRKALDALYGLGDSKDWQAYKEDLERVSHRAYTTGFFFDSGPVEDARAAKKHAQGHAKDTLQQFEAGSGYIRAYTFLGTVKDEVAPNIWSLDIKNKISTDWKIEYIGPHVPFIEDDDFTLLDENKEATSSVSHGHAGYLYSNRPIESGFMIRTLMDDESAPITGTQA
ncbi:peptidase U32 family protein [Parasphaerochaeta coccoides]|uniref:Peptidase U32 n=1 Tax=Parasphaerochaeta coccoides (strain ATCC BAA-1237 / DSM 17374 / SPN1) TaxID=760011 RepID=F4GHT0_PARC1|nr:U32 family peptidase C-terminal domain-containing protein [Parasphaerochaeta coccoides]AEC01618.1 peptidase U32 [Parasphaerochaeta coccoides DSM 17374]